MIGVQQTGSGDPMRFEVVVEVGGGTPTRHEVTASAADVARLTPKGHSPEALIEASFRFLLDRESKESILRSFDLTVISRYFPEYAREIQHYLN
jgi:hypothetical protein